MDVKKEKSLNPTECSESPEAGLQRASWVRVGQHQPKLLMGGIPAPAPISCPLLVGPELVLAPRPHTGRVAAQD